MTTQTPALILSEAQAQLARIDAEPTNFTDPSRLPQPEVEGLEDEPTFADLRAAIHTQDAAGLAWCIAGLEVVSDENEEARAYLGAYLERTTPARAAHHLAPHLHLTAGAWVLEQDPSLRALMGHMDGQVGRWTFDALGWLHYRGEKVALMAAPPGAEAMARGYQLAPGHWAQLGANAHLHRADFARWLARELELILTSPRAMDSSLRSYLGWGGYGPRVDLAPYIDPLAATLEALREGIFPVAHPYPLMPLSHQELCQAQRTVGGSVARYPHLVELLAALLGHPTPSSGVGDRTGRPAPDLYQIYNHLAGCWPHSSPEWGDEGARRLRLVETCAERALDELLASWGATPTLPTPRPTQAPHVKITDRAADLARLGELLLPSGQRLEASAIMARPAGVVVFQVQATHGDFVAPSAANPIPAILEVSTGDAVISLEVMVERASWDLMRQAWSVSASLADIFSAENRAAWRQAFGLRGDE